VSLICLKENDTLYVKVTNHTGKVIYVPKEYDGDYTNNDDTLHLETNHKPEYNTSYYYRYSNIFPFKFYTTRKIEGYEPDTVEIYKKQTYFFNQFRVQSLIPVPSDSFYIVRLQFDAPKYTTIAKAVFYYKPFLNKDRLDRVDYSLDDFVKFDSTNAYYVIAPITIRYH
jgi:hypothetical protein